MNQHTQQSDTRQSDTLPHELECAVCGHTWSRRTDGLPKACPRCKHYDWRKTNWEPEKDTRPITRTR